MKRLAPAALALAGVVLSGSLAWADTASSPRISPSPTTGVQQSSSPRTGPTPAPAPTPDPAFVGLQARIGADLANALDKQRRLSDAVAANTAS